MFIISKIIGFLLDPILWIVSLLILAFFSRRKLLKRRFYKLSLVTFLIFSNPFLVNNLWYTYQANEVPVLQKKYDAVIVLGGLAGLDNYRNMGVFNQAADRFIQTARLYETGKAGKILVTGGDPSIIRRDVYNEAFFISANFQDLQIPRQDILIEDKARNTIENAKFSKRILDSAGIQGPYLLVTSAVHMPRAKKIFDKAGMETIAYPCNYLVVRSNTAFSFDNFIPNGQALYVWKILLKEWIGQAQLVIGH